MAVKAVDVHDLQPGSSHSALAAAPDGTPGIHSPGTQQQPFAVLVDALRSGGSTAGVATSRAWFRNVSGGPNVFFFGRSERVFSSPFVFFRSSSLTQGRLRLRSVVTDSRQSVNRGLRLRFLGRKGRHRPPKERRCLGPSSFGDARVQVVPSSVRAARQSFSSTGAGGSRSCRPHPSSHPTRALDAMGVPEGDARKLTTVNGR